MDGFCGEPARKPLRVSGDSASVAGSLGADDKYIEILSDLSGILSQYGPDHGGPVGRHIFQGGRQKALLEARGDLSKARRLSDIIEAASVAREIMPGYVEQKDSATVKASLLLLAPLVEAWPAPLVSSLWERYLRRDLMPSRLADLSETGQTDEEIRSVWRPVVQALSPFNRETDSELPHIVGFGCVLQSSGQYTNELGQFWERLLVDAVLMPTLLPGQALSGSSAQKKIIALLFSEVTQWDASSLPPSEAGLAPIIREMRELLGVVANLALEDATKGSTAEVIRFVEDENVGKNEAPDRCLTILKTCLRADAWWQLQVAKWEQVVITERDSMQRLAALAKELTVCVCADTWLPAAEATVDILMNHLAREAGTVQMQRLLVDSVPSVVKGTEGNSSRLTQVVGCMENLLACLFSSPQQEMLQLHVLEAARALRASEVQRLQEDFQKALRNHMQSPKAETREEIQYVMKSLPADTILPEDLLAEYLSKVRPVRYINAETRERLCKNPKHGFTGSC